ncbi:hypothetical protein SAMN05216241_10656 [Limimonas halophila]|uniref:Uncharacterized protein n=1 Tax=Limimonas halophila TaxID=1082479 RepID=A0A1G7RZ20_9PROT|nr:hypothetical protein [Limimonas halophila]SDG16008.1 hypothetical protein SAMN05216241_10656 [Limimonas halophila]
MFWLLLGMVILLMVFDAIITMRRRPEWRRSAEQAYAHLQKAAPASDKVAMGRDAFVKHYLELCQKATTGSRLGVILGLALAWFVCALATAAVSQEPVGMLNYIAMAVVVVALPAPVLIKMVGIRKAKRFAQPPTGDEAGSAASSGAE